MLPGALLALAGRDALAGIGMRSGERRGAGDQLDLVLLGLLGFAIAALTLLGHGVSLLLSARARSAGARDTRPLPQACRICLTATTVPFGGPLRSPARLVFSVPCGRGPPTRDAMQCEAALQCHLEAFRVSIDRLAKAGTRVPAPGGGLPAIGRRRS